MCACDDGDDDLCVYFFFQIVQTNVCVGGCVCAGVCESSRKLVQLGKERKEEEEKRIINHH